MDDSADNHEAFLRLLLRHEPTVRAAIRAVVRRAEDVDEIMQAVSLVAWRKFDSLTDHKGFGSWACEIARYEVLKFQRGRARDRFVLDEALVERILEEAASDSEARRERLSLLERCLEKLPEARRRLLLQVYFTLETKEAEIVDLGTVFGVEAGSQGGCLMQVYEGEVMASAKLDAEETSPRRVLQGEAVRVNGAVRKTDFWPDRFVRLLPGPEDPAGRGNHPYNVSQFDSVRIVSAPADISIDGDLSDWNLAGRFRSSCEAPYDEDYYLEAAMMYDERQLYVGAHVGDPFPMRSQIRPIDAENQHGAGGAVALRLSTDRQAGWPLSANANGERNGRPASPADLSDKLSFVVLWFYEPEQKACIHLRHGMDLHGLKVNPPGYQGAYRKDVDGRGYTLEYAIPWNLLNAADDPPRAGDELAAMWLVHWSDPAGRKWQGQLIDVTKPNEPGWNFLRAATWGKAIYVRNP